MRHALWLFLLWTVCLGGCSLIVKDYSKIKSDAGLDAGSVKDYGKMKSDAGPDAGRVSDSGS